MAPPRGGGGAKKPAPQKDKRQKNQSQKQSQKSTSSSAPSNQTRPQGRANGLSSAENDQSDIDLSATIPLSLQQLLLNVFKEALLFTRGAGGTAQEHDQEHHQDDHQEQEQEQDKTGDGNADSPSNPQLDTKQLIQTIKSHLYNRDFDSAFADANEELLRAYALRWSAARALGYAGLFKAVVGGLGLGIDGKRRSNDNVHVVCIGGGAGAEIVALAAAWRDLSEETKMRSSMGGEDGENLSSCCPRRLAITAVDIADWSSVVRRLVDAVKAPSVPALKSHPAPLVPAPLRPTEPEQGEQGQDDQDHDNDNGHGFSVRFRRSDILTVPDEELKDLLSLFSAEKEKETNTSSPTPSTTIVTLMFTLNELFSTSMAKATGLLLRTTDLVTRGTVLLVVDSPGSYSTLKLKLNKPGSGSGSDEGGAERRYPMKFLLDHTLLSVAGGKWERVHSQDSRWWRRDAARLRYDVGEGAGLEDMRYQVHIYRRV